MIIVENKKTKLKDKNNNVKLYNMNDKILKLHSEGWAADRIAAQLMVHSQDVRAIIDGADIDLKKKADAVVVTGVVPKISKLSKKKDNGSI